MATAGFFVTGHIRPVIWAFEITDLLQRWPKALCQSKT
jgi:hypothetical protein